MVIPTACGVQEGKNFAKQRPRQKTTTGQNAAVETSLLTSVQAICLRDDFWELDVAPRRARKEKSLQKIVPTGLGRGSTSKALVPNAQGAELGTLA